MDVFAFCSLSRYDSLRVEQSCQAGIVKTIWLLHRPQLAPFIETVGGDKTMPCPDRIFEGSVIGTEPNPDIYRALIRVPKMTGNLESSPRWCDKPCAIPHLAIRNCLDSSDNRTCRARRSAHPMFPEF